MGGGDCPTTIAFCARLQRGLLAESVEGGPRLPDLSVDSTVSECPTSERPRRRSGLSGSWQRRPLPRMGRGVVEYLPRDAVARERIALWLLRDGSWVSLQIGATRSPPSVAVHEPMTCHQ